MHWSSVQLAHPYPALRSRVNPASTSPGRQEMLAATQASTNLVPQATSDVTPVSTSLGRRGTVGVFAARTAKLLTYDSYGGALCPSG